MRTLPTLSDLLPDYEAAIRTLRRNGTLTPAQGFDLVVAFYRQVRIGAAVAGDANDEDMLLFQYGTQDWHDGRGAFFGLDITRQVIINDAEEQLIYQLSLAFEFDPAPFSACPPYNSWSTTIPALDEWSSSQKATEGFQLAQARPCRAINLGMQQV